MWVPLALAAALAACGGAGGGGGQARATGDGSTPRSALPNVAPLPGFNPLIGVWGRIAGAHCRFGTIEFTAARMTAEPPAGGEMMTVAVSYDTSVHGAPVARPAGGAPLRFRVIDADHLADDTDCVLARAD